METEQIFELYKRSQNGIFNLTPKTGAGRLLLIHSNGAHMRIIAKRTLIEFYEQLKYRDAKGSLEAWHEEVKKAAWQTSHDIRRHYSSASFVGNRVVFNIHGNKYRLIVLVNYRLQQIFIKFIGTHKQYDAIDVATVRLNQ